MSFGIWIKRLNYNNRVAFNNPWLRFSLVTLLMYSISGYVVMLEGNIKLGLSSNSIQYLLICAVGVGLVGAILDWSYHILTHKKIEIFDYVKFFLTSVVAATITACGVLFVTLKLTQLNMGGFSLLLLCAIAVSLIIGISKKKDYLKSVNQIK